MLGTDSITIKLSYCIIWVKETKDAYLIDVAAPGFNKDSFNIKVEDSLLTISGEVKEEKLEEGEKFTRKEFGHTAFKRSFTIFGHGPRNR